MMLIDCPFCGPRAELEFTCGGESHIARPADQAAMSDAEWADYLFMRKNPKGLHYERWNHARGCRRWFNVARDTVTHRISKVYKMGEQRVSEQSHRMPPGRPHRPQPAARLHLRRQALRGLCRRHPGLGPARQWRRISSGAASNTTARAAS